MEAWGEVGLPHPPKPRIGGGAGEPGDGRLGPEGQPGPEIIIIQYFRNRTMILSGQGVNLVKLQLRSLR